MNKKVLIGLMEVIATRDLECGGDIHDHPCTVAVRAIKRYTEDIGKLQRLAKGSEKGKSKSDQELVRGIYCPNF
mgnify:CR=1 FL=1